MKATLIGRTGTVAEMEFKIFPPPGYILTLAKRRRYVVVGGALDAGGGVEIAVLPLPDEDISLFGLILNSASEHVRWAADRAFARTMKARGVREELEAQQFDGL